MYFISELLYTFGEKGSEIHIVHLVILQIEHPDLREQKCFVPFGQGVLFVV